MTELAYPFPEIGEPSVAADPRTLTALQNIKAWTEGQIDSTNIKTGSIETGPLKNEAVTEAKLSVAVQTLLNAKVSGLTFKAYSGPATLKAGEFAIQEKNGETFTLPSAAVANQSVGAWCSPVASCKVAAAGSSKIYGEFVNANTTLTLTTNQFVILQSTPGANWFITSGEPKREQVYAAKKGITKGEAEAGVEASATRPAVVIFNVDPTGLSIGGVGELPTARTIWLNPGQKWSATVSIEYSQVLL